MNPRKNDFERAVSLLHRDGYTCIPADPDRIRTNRCRIWPPQTT